MFSYVKPNNTCSLDSNCLSFEVSSQARVTCLWRVRHETDPKYTTMCSVSSYLVGTGQTLQREPCKLAVQAMHLQQLGHTARNPPLHSLQACYLLVSSSSYESQHLIRRFNSTVVVSRFALETLMVSKGNKRFHDQTDNAGTDKAVSHSAFPTQISNIGIPWILINTHQTKLHEFHYLKLHPKSSHWMTASLI